ncbi:MBOAT family O-acyltransferase [Leptospira ilyithenensis]|uniref:MBOAT family protein n=1 Tax=Leptospira ilyithenensis TaxID=2484901 RepID=A0A4R9LKD7_9LEPT|nr:MBOAT family O-acyltransferase [Leptospira ilyithenensis]TGN08035.1 MBOAT family protein [Leptospira ilyithenensis]
MVFSSIVFLLLFLPLVISFYFLVRREYQNSVLISFSLLFYFWGESYYLIILVASVVFNYLIGIFLEERKSKPILFFGIFINLSAIAYFKYYNFFLQNLFQFSGEKIDLLEIHLPIGISFFTFQMISYLIDIYRGQVHAQFKFSRFLLYISFFPQLIAGPIVRYIDIQRDLISRKIKWTDVDVGLKRFILGLAKKVLIANPAAFVADKIFALPSTDLNTPLAWLAVLSYTIQIYYDFSGYSDMAIGLGRLFGFHFIENFNLPYSANSIQDFWRRWHISLSTWFRDYVYVPLGGNRVSQHRLVMNLLVVFFLTGLWHGASWNFIIWGLLHGFFLLAERYFLSDILKKIPYFLGNIYTILTVMVAWVFFRVEGLRPALHVVKLLFSFRLEDTVYHPGLYINSLYLVSIFFGIVFSYPIKRIIGILFERLFASYDRFPNLYYITKSFAVILLLVLSILNLAGSTYNPFIYFRF